MKNKLIKGLVATAVLAALAGCNGSDNTVAPESFKLTIAHINDTHSAFEEDSYDFTAKIGDEDFSVRTSAGGYPRLLTALDAARSVADESDMPFLAVHAGDAFQGSLYFNILKGEGNATLLRELDLDAMVIGNHEFDLGNEPLIDFAEKVNFPLLAANLDTSADAAMNAVDNIKPYIIKEYDGKKVAIFGIVLEDMDNIAAPGADLIFNKEIETAQATVDALREMGVDKVVLLSHVGLQRDILIAEGVNGVDVIVGGHSHTLLGDFTNIGNGNGSEAAGYASMFTNPNGTSKTCIVQAGASAQALGEVNVSFVNGEITECDGGNTVLIDNEAFVAEQSNIAITKENDLLSKIIEIDYAPLIEELKAKVIGDVYDANDPTDTRSLDHVRQPGVARNGASLAVTGSEAGAQVAASMVWKLNKLGYEVDMAITNNGGVRNDIVAGDDGLTAGYIIGSLLYFGNELAIVELKGADITQLLEDTINYSIDKSSGSFPTFANLEFTFNGQAVVGAQIEGLNVCPGGVTAGSCVAIKTDEVYKIATNAYIASGKDGYEIFDTKKQSEVIKSGFIDNESMIEYVEALTAEGKKLEELPTGLTFIAPDRLAIDNPLVKPTDN